MNERRWAASATLWVLGAWLFLSVTMAYVAGANFVQLEPENLRNAGEVFEAIPDDDRFRALRYVASELNRHFFTRYARVQEVLGVLALILLALSRRGRWIGVGLVLFAAATTIWFDMATAEIAAMGREIDFVRDPETVAAFDRFHDRAVKVEGAKMIAILAASVLLIRTPRSKEVT